MEIELSLIIPAFNEGTIIEQSISRIAEVARTISSTYELIVVDDGSCDDTWQLIKQLHAQNQKIRGIRFSRNFGKESAICAGMDQARGAAVVILDADLQHPPEIMIEMMTIWRNGQADVVRAVKSDRGEESWFYKLSSKIFYRTMRLLSGLDLKNASDFMLLDRKVIQALKCMPEQAPFLRGMVAWVGFRQKVVTFTVPVRQGSTTKWRRRALIKYALSNLLSFSSMPLRIVYFLATCFFVFTLILGSFSLYQFFRHNAIEGYTTLILVLLLIGSSIMTGLGIIGEYIAKIYEEVKMRPRYFKKDEFPTNDL